MAAYNHIPTNELKLLLKCAEAAGYGHRPIAQSYKRELERRHRLAVDALPSQPTK